MLLIQKEGNSHYIFVNDFNRFMYNKIKHKNKNYFCMSSLQIFSSLDVLEDHRKVCLEN